ncbi:MAG: S8 family serine peptidase, partial [Actinomycetota bacterium]|nr:S8 family serine peptidase [Actinomycetota bacterium]
AYGAASDAGSCGQQGILSTWPSGSTTFDTSCGSRSVRTSVGGDNRFAYLVGTSMATPQVAGLVALMRAAKPDLPAAKLVRLVKLTASNCGQYRDGIGWGRIDAPAALAAALDRDIDPPGSNLRRSGPGRLRLKRFDKADCSDELPSSGVKVVSVFASRNGGKYRRIAKTKKKTVRFRPKRGGRYRFYSIATDKAGNREAPPPEPDERIRVKL